MPHFYCKLVAPRPTFAMDMDDEEKMLMGRHAAYWQAQLGAAVIVFGPVFDPKGPFGLGIVRFDDEAGVRAFTEADPVIVAGRGFVYEIHQMQAVTE